MSVCPLHYTNSYKVYKGYEGLWGRCVTCDQFIQKHCSCESCVQAVGNKCCSVIYYSPQTVIYAQTPCGRCQLPPLVK